MNPTQALRAASFLAAVLGASSARAVLPPASSWDLYGEARVTVSGPGGSSRARVAESIRLTFDGAGAWGVEFVSDPLPPDLSGIVQDARGNRFVLVPDAASEEAYFEPLRLAILDAQPLISDLVFLKRKWTGKGKIRSGDSGDELLLKVRMRARMEAFVLGRSPRLRMALKGRYEAPTPP